MSRCAAHSFEPAVPNAKAISPSGAGAQAARRVEAAELVRLEQCLARVRHECAVAMLEAAPHARPKYRGPRLPPAAQLASVPGIPPVQEFSTGSGPVGKVRELLPFHPAPPLAAERLQPPRPTRQPSGRLRGALYLLITSLIAGSIGYQLAGVSPTEAAHAALAVVAGTK